MSGSLPTKGKSCIDWYICAMISSVLNLAMMAPKKKKSQAFTAFFTAHSVQVEFAAFESDNLKALVTQYHYLQSQLSERMNEQT